MSKSKKLSFLYYSLGIVTPGVLSSFISFPRCDHRWDIAAISFLIVGLFINFLSLLIGRKLKIIKQKNILNKETLLIFIGGGFLWSICALGFGSMNARC